MGTWRNGTTEVLLGRAPDTVESLDTADVRTVRRFCENFTLGIPSPGLVREVPESLLKELISLLRTETKGETPA